MANTDGDNNKEVDFVIFGLGNPQQEALSTRHNAGWIFVDYLSNCVSLQQYLVEEVKKRREVKAKEEAAGTKKAATATTTTTTTAPIQTSEEEEVLKDIKGEDGIPKYSIPTFSRRRDLGADIHDVTFTLTEDMLNESGKETGVKAEKLESKTLRLILVKPLTGMEGSGNCVRYVLSYYQIPPQDLSKKMIVVLDDQTILPGSIQIKDATENRLVGHKGVDSIAKSINSAHFIRFRIGIGRPAGSQTPDQFVMTSFSKENKEMDMLGYALDLTAQALQYFAATNDLKKTKKKFASSKKLPNNLRKMEGLLFPCQIVDNTPPPPEQPKPAAAAPTQS